MQVIGGCRNGECPKVMVNEAGEVFVQGYVTAEAAPDGEVISLVPAEVLLEAADALRERAAR